MKHKHPCNNHMQENGKWNCATASHLNQYLLLTVVEQNETTPQQLHNKVYTIETIQLVKLSMGGKRLQATAMRHAPASMSISFETISLFSLFD